MLNIKVVEYNINFGKKLVLISDIHYTLDISKRLLDNVIKKIKDINPDYIFIAGDLLDNYDVPKTGLINFIKELSFTKVIMVLGNHDISRRSKNKWFLELKSENIYPLYNNYYKDDNITVYGHMMDYKYYENKEEDLKKLKNSLKNIKADILLTHSPINLYKLNLNNFKLVLCGHSHGGLLPLRFKTNLGIISPFKKWFPKYVRGNYKNVYISSGLTKFSITSGIFRPLNRLYSPEITLIK
jgi:predicted MPP superfamily phosphohydrolase